MDFLRARCTGEVMDDLLGDGLVAGQSARVLAGPFADQLVTIEALPGSGRVKVLLEIMGGTRSVQLDRAHLGPA
jgi:transcription antitermination factor NusG